MQNNDPRLVDRLLAVMENDILSLTRSGVANGNKVFGAALLRKDDLSVVLAETNNETDNPLWHGEVHTLKRFYERSAGERPDTKDLIFLSTHEPCSMCLSAITWAGFDNFFTKPTLQYPHWLPLFTARRWATGLIVEISASLF